MTNSPFSEIGHYNDVESLNYHRLALAGGVAEEEILRSLAAKSRDHARTPVQWDDAAHAGFSTATPWFTTNPNHVEINAQAAVADPGSIHAHYKALIALRHDEQIVQEGRFEPLLPEHEQIWAFTRTLEAGEHGAGGALLVVANCSSAPVELPVDALPPLGGAQLLLGTHADAAASVLAPWESRILRLA